MTNIEQDENNISSNSSHSNYRSTDGKSMQEFCMRFTYLYQNVIWKVMVMDL